MAQIVWQNPGTEVAKVCKILNPFTPPSLARQDTLDNLVVLVNLLKHFAENSTNKDSNGNKKYLEYVPIVLSLRAYVATHDSLMRASTFRVFRHLIIERDCDRKILEIFLRYRIHFFIIRSLERESKYVLERMEALKLVRKMMSIDSSTIPKCLVQTLVAISLHKEDALRAVALETVREIVVLNPSVVADCGGMRAIVTAMIDPSLEEMADSMILTVVYLLTSDRTRQYIRPKLEIGILLAPFTGTGNQNNSAKGIDPYQKKLWNTCRRAIVLLMKTWAGLIVLAGDPNGLRSLIQILVQPVSIELREAVLETIMCIFRSIDLASYGTGPGSVEEGAGILASNTHVNDNSNKTKKHKGTIRSRNESKGKSYNYDDDKGEAEIRKLTKDLSGCYWGIGPGAEGAKILSSGKMGFDCALYNNASNDRINSREGSNIDEKVGFSSALLDNYMAMVLLAFTRLGLGEALLEMCVHDELRIAQPATELLSFLLRKSERLMPEYVCRDFLSTASLINKASRATKVDKSASMLSLLSDRSDEQRARSVASYLSTMLGSGHDIALATLLCRSTYQDGYALATELSLAAKKADTDNYGSIFPRETIAVLPSPEEISVQSVYHNNGGGAGASPKLRQRGKKLIRSLTWSNTSEVQKNTIKKKKQLHKSKLSSALYDVSRSILRTEKPCKVEAMTISNRGHRRLVQQLTLTDMAFGEVNDMGRLLNRSKVLAGKDWSMWNWSIIDEIVSGPLRNPDAFGEIVKTKFLKRILGFYRVSISGQFILLPWKPDNVVFSNIISTLLSILLQSQQGVQLLRNDRRGKIHTQIVISLKTELEQPEAMVPNQPGSSLSISGSALPSRSSDMISGPGFGSGSLGERILTPLACMNTMTKDVFIMMGVYSTFPNGLELMAEVGLFDVLTELSKRSDKDYITRLALTHLDYANSSSCRDWFHSIITHGNVSVEVQLFGLSLLRSITRCHYAQENANIIAWILECMVAMLTTSEKRIESGVLSLLFECAHYPSYLEPLISVYKLEPFTKDGKLLDNPLLRHVLVKYLENRAGVELLRDEGWIQEALDTDHGWAFPDIFEHVIKIEALFTSKLLKSNTYLTMDNDPPKPKERSNIAQNPGRGIHPLRTPRLKQVIMFEPKPIPLRAHDSGVRVSGSGCSNISDLWALFQVPWSIEIWLVSPGGQKNQIPVFTFVDCVPVHNADPIHDRPFMISENGIFTSNVRITAVPISGQKHQIPEDATIYACISIGDLIMNQSGYLDPSPQCGGGFGNVTTPNTDELTGSLLKYTSHIDSNPNGRSNAKLPWNDTRWVRCEPEYRSAVVADLWGESSLSSKEISVCPGGDCAASFRLVVAVDDDGSGAPTNSPKYPSSTSGRSSSRRGTMDQFVASRADSNRSEHNVINPLFAASLMREGSMKFKTANSSNPPLSPSELSQPSSPASSTRPFVVPDSATTNLDSVSFHLTLVPERPAGPTAPPQFYGQLGKTETGARILSASKHLTTFTQHLSSPKHEDNTGNVFFERYHLSSFGSFNNHLSQYGLDKTLESVPIGETNVQVNSKRSSDVMVSSSSKMMIRRAFLWIIGTIGSSTPGLEILLKQNGHLISLISDIALNDECLSMRGTAVNVLGLISRCSLGSKLLKTLGWEGCDANYGVVVPKDVESFFNVSSGDTSTGILARVGKPVEGVMPKSYPGLNFQFEDIVEPDPASQVPAYVIQATLRAVSDLSNHIAHIEAHSSLMKIKSSYPAVFSSPFMFVQVHTYLGSYTYELRVRQFLLGLFHQSMRFDRINTWALLDRQF